MVSANTIFMASVIANVVSMIIILGIVTVGREAWPFTKARLFRKPLLFEVRGDNEVVPTVVEYKSGAVKSKDKTWIADTPYSMSGVKVFFAFFYGQTLNLEHVAFGSRLKEMGYSNPKQWLMKVLEKQLHRKTSEVDIEKLEDDNETVELKDSEFVSSRPADIEKAARDKAIEFGESAQLLTYQEIEEQWGRDIDEFKASENGSKENKESLLKKISGRVSPYFNANGFDISVPMNRVLRFPDIVNMLMTNTQPTLIRDVEVNAAMEEKLNKKGPSDLIVYGTIFAMVVVGGAVAYLLISHGATSTVATSVSNVAGQSTEFLPVGG